MVELRWVERDVPCSWGKDGKVDGMSRDRVLQYRTAISGYSDGNGFTRYDNEWSKWTGWQDVPTVREE